MEGEAATSMRLTRGCGSLDVTKPHIGGLTIEETSERQDSARKSSDKRRKETREGRKRDGAGMEMKCECDLCEYVLVHHWYILVCTGINNAFLNI